jgi:hypothetical protein
MAPRKIWKKKCTTAQQNRNLEDIVAVRNSEKNRDAPTDIDVDQEE